MFLKSGSRPGVLRLRSWFVIWRVAFVQVVGRRRHPDAPYRRLGRVVAEGRLEGAGNRPRRRDRQQPASPGGKYVSSNRCNLVATITARQEVLSVLSERGKTVQKVMDWWEPTVSRLTASWKTNAMNPIGFLARTRVGNRMFR